MSDPAGGPPLAGDGLEVRRLRPGDEPGVLSLLQASLGWVPDDLFGRFFAWKHRENPFGESPAWVAVEGDRVVAFRAFLRWEFVRAGLRGPSPVAGVRLRAVRAVDTATHPEWQGRGLFKRLTTLALEELRAEGVAFVFNTPNARSAPGYLKMGWQEVGNVPVAARLSSLRSLPRLSRSRRPADRWSVATSVGLPAEEALADSEAVADLLNSQPVPPGGTTTARSADFLRWRYGFEPLAYRALVPRTGAVAEGVVLFRLRRRGPSLEAAICDVLVPGGDRRRAAALVVEVARRSGAGYALRVGAARPRSGFLPVPGLGPRLLWRGVSEATMPPLREWELVLGDVELF